MTGSTFHLVAQSYFDSTDPAAEYRPEAFDADGFIHCTDGLHRVVETANRYYREDPRRYVLLVIDKARVASAIKYEDRERVYPHIYGALNRDAIDQVVPLERAKDGTFLPLQTGTPLR